MGPSVSLQIHRHGPVASQRVLSDVSNPKQKMCCQSSQCCGFSGRHWGGYLTACSSNCCRGDLWIAWWGAPTAHHGWLWVFLRHPHLLATLGSFCHSAHWYITPEANSMQFGQVAVMEIVWLHGRVEGAGCIWDAPWWFYILGS